MVFHSELKHRHWEQLCTCKGINFKCTWHSLFSHFYGVSFEIGAQTRREELYTGSRIHFNWPRHLIWYAAKLNPGPLTKWPQSPYTWIHFVLPYLILYKTHGVWYVLMATTRAMEFQYNWYLLGWSPSNRLAGDTSRELIQHSYRTVVYSCWRNLFHIDDHISILSQTYFDISRVLTQAHTLSGCNEISAREAISQSFDVSFSRCQYGFTI